MEKDENALSKEIYELKKSLNRSNEEKEKAYRDCNKINAQIKNLISLFKKLKNKRDELTKEVKELKERRRSCGELIKNRISELKKCREEKRRISAQFSVSPSKIKREIEAVERKIETTVISHEKEQQLMKYIKEKKRQLDEMKILFDMNKKIKDIKNDLDSLRRDSDSVHRAVQEKAAESQTYHEEILKISKQLDSLRENKRSLLREYQLLKSKFNEMNNALKERLLKLSTAAVIGKITRDSLEKKRRKELLESKEKEIEEKFKKGEKLTTEDLLAFQNK